MNQILSERVEAYLDGRLSDEDTHRFEQDLSQPDVAGAFSEAMLLRDLLSDLPPDTPPPGLTARIEAALNLGAASVSAKVKTGRGRLGNVIDAFGWGLRWPRYALDGMTNMTQGLRQSISGLNTIGYALGPLQKPSIKGLDAILRPKKSLWKIALSHLW